MDGIRGRRDNRLAARFLFPGTDEAKLFYCVYLSQGQTPDEFQSFDGAFLATQRASMDVGRVTDIREGAETVVDMLQRAKAEHMVDSIERTVGLIPWSPGCSPMIPCLKPEITVQGTASALTATPRQHPTKT